MPGTPTRSGGNRDLYVDTTRNDGPPQEPAGLSTEASNKWQELLGQLPTEALRQIDVHQLRLLCELLAQSDGLAQSIATDPANDKARRLFLATCDRVAKLSASFGLSPLDRKRSKLEPEPAVDDGFDAWLAKGPGKPRPTP